MTHLSATTDPLAANAQDASNASSETVQQTQLTESRHDPLHDRWTLFAPDRGERPIDYVENVEALLPKTCCPFCEGHEDQTPPPRWMGRIHRNTSAKDSLVEIDKDPKIDSYDRDWSVRVVPNKFPAVNDLSIHDVVDSATDSQISKQSLLKRKPMYGGHEVIIESPEHVRSLSQLSPLHTELMLRAYQDRLRHYRTQSSVQYVSIFKNVGRSAGASLSHSHSQLLAMTQMPSQVARSLSLMQRHRATTGCCLLCDLLREERSAKRRIVARDKRTIAFCPFASPLPMMTRITTVSHHAAFEDLDETHLKSVARMLFRMIGWIEKECPGSSYNYFLNTQPLGQNDPSDSFHWSIDLFPRLTHQAGFEWSSGCMINPVLPETAAQRYRSWVKAENPRWVE